MGNNDDRVVVRKSTLIEYRNFLESRKQFFIDNAKVLSSALVDLEWRDAIFYEIVGEINKHIDTMNKLISGMSDAITNLDKFVNELDGYFNSVRPLC